MEERSFHPIADLFPLLEGEEFERFVESIREHGQQVPILVMPDPDGRVLDGRNRWLACKKLGVVPRTRIYDGDTSEAAVAARIAALNLERRHLNESQRAMIAAKLMEIMKPSEAERRQIRSEASKLRWARDRGEEYRKSNLTSCTPGEPTREKAAKLLNVGPITVTRARQVQLHGSPELVSAVDAGKVAVNTAYNLSALPPEKQNAALAGSKEELRLAARQGDRVRMEQARSMRAAKARSETRQKASPNGQPPSAAATELRTDFMSSDTIDALERLLSVRWTPEEAVAKFDPRQIQSLERVRERATAWLVEFNALWEARCGADDKRRAG